MNTRQHKRGLQANTVVIYNERVSVFRVVFSCTEAINTIKHLTEIYQVQFKVTTFEEYLK